MKHKLNGMDRLIIPKLLPEKGGMLEQTVVKEIVEIIRIKSEEFDDFGLKEEKATGSLSWHLEKIKTEKEFDLTKTHTDALKEAVEKTDKEKNINQQNLETCLKIKKMR